MSDIKRALPRWIDDLVSAYIDSEVDSSIRYSNREPLDESGIWSLYALAAAIFDAGWKEGEAIGAERQRTIKRVMQMRDAAATPSEVPGE